MRKSSKTSCIVNKLLACTLAWSMVFSPLLGGEFSMVEVWGLENQDSGPQRKVDVAQQKKLRLWYDKPAPITSTDSRWWQSCTLALGNSNIGGLVFGAVAKDRVHFNEKTLWIGGPKGNTGNDALTGGNPYNGGNRLTYAGDTLRNQFLQELDGTDKMWGLDVQTANSKLTNNFFSGRSNKGRFMDFGDIFIDFSASGVTDTNVTNYVRELDLETGVSRVSYDYNGATYTREYYVSYPDNVMVMRLKTTNQNGMDFKVSMAGNMEGTKNFTTANHRITLKGELTDNKLKYQSQVAVKAEAGTITDNTDNTISVSKGQDVVVVLGAGTDYVNEFPTYRGADPDVKVTNTVDRAIAKTSDALLAAHLADYQKLFGRVDFKLTDEIPNIPTD